MQRGKRAAKSQLTDKMLEEGVDLKDLGGESEVLVLRSKEEFEKAGKPFMRLKRTLKATPADGEDKAQKLLSDISFPTNFDFSLPKGSPAPKEASPAGREQQNGAANGVEHKEEVITSSDTATAPSPFDGTAGKEPKHDVAQAAEKTPERTASPTVAAETSQSGGKGSEVPGAATAATQKIFGDLFNAPFTNPLAEAAARGGEHAFGSAPSKEEIPQSSEQKEDDESENEEATTESASPCGSKCGPGEEEEDEVFVESNAVLYKLVAPETKKEEEKTDVEKGSEKKVAPTTPKFKRQAEGVFKLLEARKEASESNAAKAGAKRLLFRQKGTGIIFLNSPLWISNGRFDLMPPMSAGAGVRFAALDNVKSDGKPATVAIYCLKVESESRLESFLSLAREATGKAAK